MTPPKLLYPSRMDPLSATAAVVGITTPAVHCIRLLLGDLQKIADAPETLKSLKKDLLSVDQALTSLQAVSDPQWKSLGETVVSHSKGSLILTMPPRRSSAFAWGR